MAIEFDEKIVPSKLREHINQEQLRPPESLFERSLPLIFWYALRPHLFIALVVVIAAVIEPSPFIMILVAFPLLLAAQRSGQTLVHDLSHRLFSRDMKKNDLLGNLFAAGWIGASVSAYRRVHMQHHKHNGSQQDPEHISFELIRQRGGLALHCLRYVIGLEAFRLVNKYYNPVASSPKSVDGGKVEKSKDSKWHIILCQLLLVLIFHFLANAWYLYLLWLYLAVTWNPLLSNLRFLVEHPGESDLTVSTRCSVVEGMYFAPFNFNYHLEHHLWPSLPPYKLKQAHKYLSENSYFARHPEFLGDGYFGSLWSRD